MIFNRDDGGDEVCSGDGGDVLAHEPSEAAAQGVHDRLGVDDVAAFEVPLVVAALGEEAAQRGARATALFLLLGLQIKEKIADLPYFTRCDMKRYGADNSRTSRNVRLESAKRAKADIDQVAVTYRDL